MMTDLAAKKCQACEGGVSPLKKGEVDHFLEKVNGWSVNESGTVISKTFRFKGFYKTMAFVNAIAWIANQELHHPEMVLSFDRCTVNFTTHAIGGLSENDFICAAKIDALLPVL